MKIIHSEQYINKEEVVADNVVVAESRAAEAGIEIFKKGGNAVDAAIATSFATTLYEPEVSSLGGGAYMTIHMADVKKTIGIEYNGRLPHSITDDLWVRLNWLLPQSATKVSFGWRAVKDDQNTWGYKSLGVPGMLAGMCWALDNYGTMPLDEVMKPAIRLAETGWEVNETVALRTIRGMPKMLNLKYLPNQTLAKYLLKEGRYPPSPGDKIKAKDLAETMKKIADEGPDIFYKGEIAKTIVKDLRKYGALITEEDFAAYQPTIYRENLLNTYRGHKIFGPYHGGTTFIEMANMLEGYDLKSLGHNTAESIHYMAEAMRRAWADRFRWHGDPEFEKVPLKGMASKKYAAEMRKFISETASTDIKPGNPWKYETSEPTPGGVGLKPSLLKGTTHMCTADKDHNMVSLCMTLGGHFGGFVITEETGVIIRNYTNLFDTEPGRPNSLGPWKRPLSHHIPLIILGKNNAPFICMGAPGGRKVITSQLQILLNIVDYGMSIQEAHSAPKMFCQGADPSVPEGKFINEIEVDSHIPENVVNGLRQKGHEVVVRKEKLSSVNFALPLSIMVNEKTGKLHSGVDPIRGVALGIDL